MLYTANPDIEFLHRIKSEHSTLICNIRQIISNISTVSELSITADLKIKSLYDLSPNINEKLFQEKNFCSEIEKKQDIKIYCDDNLSWQPLIPTTWFLFLKYKAISPFLYVDDWIYWFIYCYLKYSKIEQNVNNKPKIISGEYYLHLFGKTEPAESIP